MESPRSREILGMEQSEKIIQEEPQEDFEGSPSIETKKGSHHQLASTSVSSTTSSRSHSLNRSMDAPNTIYPTMVWNTLRSNRKRRGSLPMTHHVLAVQEEEATQEIDSTKTLKLKQIKSMRDYGEFSTNEVRKSRGFEKNQDERRARSFDKSDLPLEKVQEAKNEEDRFVSHFSVERRWMGIKDCNEFNSKEINRKSKEKMVMEPEMHIGYDQISVSDIKGRKFSLNNTEENPIPEEEMKEKHGRQGVSHPLHLPSPKMNKLKVDEIDFERKRSEFEQYHTLIDDDEELLTTTDVIKEDALEDGPNQQAEELLEKAKHKMTGEREFLKKFLRCESNDEMDKMRTTIERELSNSQNRIEITQTICEENAEIEG